MSQTCKKNVTKSEKSDKLVKESDKKAQSRVKKSQICEKSHKM